MTEMSLNHFKHKDVIVLLSTEQKKLYVSTVYIASDMFKIMGILFIKVFLQKINPKLNEIKRKVIEIHF